MENIDQHFRGVQEFSTPDHLDDKSQGSLNQDKDKSSTPSNWYF